MVKPQSLHGHLSSRGVFIFAATGSAVGLGNLWKFPYLVGENGGGAFLLVYCACLLLIAVPLMMAELLIGRNTERSPANAVRLLAEKSSRDPRWQGVGVMAVVAGLMILAIYSVVAGWVIHYMVSAGGGELVDLGYEQANLFFSGMLADPRTLFLWHSLFMIAVIIIIAAGVRHGVENATRVLMPVLFALLLVLLGYAMTMPTFQQAVDFLFVFEPEQLTWKNVSVALGHAFFTLTLGGGVMMTLGAYMPKHASIGHAVVWVAVLDTLVAIIAGLIIFPVVFAAQIEPSAGPGLMFISLPIAFAQIPIGPVIGFLFFFLVTAAALTSSLALFEPAVAWMVERMQVRRIFASLILGALVWLVGIAVLLSFNTLDHLQIFNKSIFKLLDFLTANIMLPAGGILIAIFTGWKIRRYICQRELSLPKVLFFSWYLLIRFVVPVAICVIFYQNL